MAEGQGPVRAHSFYGLLILSAANVRPRIQINAVVGPWRGVPNLSLETVACARMAAATPRSSARPDRGALSLRSRMGVAARRVP